MGDVRMALKTATKSHGFENPQAERSKKIGGRSVAG
jgi:hypothetical protein